MNKKDIARFKKILSEQRHILLNTVSTSKEQGLGFNSEDLSDEIDLASSETDQSLNLRLRDRERILLKKIERTLEKIELRTEEAKPLLVEKSLYEGLRKVEDRAYAGPTSIKYWM